MVHEIERFIRRVTLSSGTLSFPFKTVSWIRGKLGDLEGKKVGHNSCALLHQLLLFNNEKVLMAYFFFAEMQLIISLFPETQFYLQHSSAVCILV